MNKKQQQKKPRSPTEVRTIKRFPWPFLKVHLQSKDVEQKAKRNHSRLVTLRTLFLSGDRKIHRSLPSLPIRTF